MKKLLLNHAHKYTNKFSKYFSSKIDYSYNTKDFLSKTKEYENSLMDYPTTPTNLQDTLETINSPLPGFATSTSTSKYLLRNTDSIHPMAHKSNFRKTYNSNLSISSLGIGTYLGDSEDLTDYYMYTAIKSALMSNAINVIDTSINYRYMKSEKVIGKVLNSLVHKYKYSRDEFIVCSKVGFVPEDSDNGKRSHFFVEELVEKDQINVDDIIFDELKRPVHCIHPEYIKKQVEISLQNLNIETLDVLYLHNVFESQSIIGKDKLTNRILYAMEALEELKFLNKIKAYGFASWNSFRVNSENTLHSSIYELKRLAEKVNSDKSNGLEYIQTPINIMNPEAFIEKYQKYEIKGAENKEKSEITENTVNTDDISKDNINNLKTNELENMNKINTENTKQIITTLTAVCAVEKVNIISSSPLLQGYLLKLPLENRKFGVYHNSSKHLQLIRSIPAEALKSTLVGMKKQSSVRNNLEVVKAAPLTASEFYDILAPKKRTPYVEKESNI